MPLWGYYPVYVLADSKKRKDDTMKKKKVISVDVTNQRELDLVFALCPDKLVGLTNGFGCIHVYIYDKWSDVPHDAHRQGIWQGGEKATPPPGWKNAEIRIQNYVGPE